MAIINGNVGGSAKSIKDIDVTLRKVGGEIVNNTVTDDLGTFKFAEINAGSYELQMNRIVLSSGVNSINGRVFINTFPGKGLEVKCFSSSNEMLETVSTDLQGKFQLNGLPDGEVTSVILIPVKNLPVSAVID